MKRHVIAVTAGVLVGLGVTSCGDDPTEGAAAKGTLPATQAEISKAQSMRDAADNSVVVTKTVITDTRAGAGFKLGYAKGKLGPD
jgi:hypothetical protein